MKYNKQQTIRCTSSFLSRVVHVVDVDEMAVQVATVLHLQRERAVAEDAHVTLELCRCWDLFCGRFGVIGHLTRPGAVEARVIAALRGAIADVTSPFMAAVDALVLLQVSRFTSLAWKHQGRWRCGFNKYRSRAVFSWRRCFLT